ncbi:MAG: hypothetical protein KKB31_07675 [Nanoarchaeota archaeon]|nr:hypothetical protein [Nanoarchaeota archaeon]
MTIKQITHLANECSNCGDAKFKKICSNCGVEKTDDGVDLRNYIIGFLFVLCTGLFALLIVVCNTQ